MRTADEINARIKELAANMAINAGRWEEAEDELQKAWIRNTNLELNREMMVLQWVMEGETQWSL